MAENTDSGLMLEGAELEDARHVIGWAIRWSVGDWRSADTKSVGDKVALLAAREEVGSLLDLPGHPYGQLGPLGPAELETLRAAAAEMAEVETFCAVDEAACAATPIDDAMAAFHRQRAVTCWRVCVALMPLESAA